MSRTVQSIVQSLSASTGSSRELAVALHNFVRDEIPFGFTDRFDLATPEHTLQQGRGHCTPKTNLLVHLLRQAGFDDATVVSVPIPNTVFDNLEGRNSFPGTVQHCFTEVTVEGRACRLDSYVTDKPLFNAALSKFKLDNNMNGNQTKLGCAIHRDGTCEWDGQSDAFSQYMVQTPEIERRYSSTADLVADSKYYEHSDFISMLRVPFLGRLMGSFVLQNNRPIELLRSTPSGAPTI